MMKNFILTLMCGLILSISPIQAQYDLLDFETPATGNGFTWAQFGNAPTADNTTLNNVANPSMVAPNTSATVTLFDVNPTSGGAQFWGGASTDDIDLFEFDATNTTIKIKVYSTSASLVKIKFEAAGGGGTTAEVDQWTTGAGTWEELTYDFSAANGNGQTYGRLVVFPDFQDPHPAQMLYFDDIQLPDNNIAPPPSCVDPTAAAPTPTHDETMDNVLSVFSDSYTDVAGTDFFPNWGQSTVVTDEMVAGDPVKKYASLNYQGTQFASALDVSGNEFLHVDFYTCDATALNLYLISSGPVEVAYALPITLDTWVSVDIPLSSFGAVNLADVIQFKVDGNGTIWWDNWYFHGSSTPPPACVDPTVAAPTPTHDETMDNVLSIFSDAYTDVAGTDFNPGWGQATLVTNEMIAGNATMKYANLNYQGTQFAGAQDVSGNEFLHVDFYTCDATAINFSLISSGPVETAFALPVALDAWVSVDIPLSYFSAAGVDLADIIQFKVDDAATGEFSTVWFDNWYFHGSTTPPVCMDPTTAAPAPAHSCVMSIFSDEYTDIAGTDFNPNWGQATAVSNEMVAGDNVMKYSTLNYQGTQFGAALDVSGQDFLHVDFYTCDATALNFYLISPGGVETAYALPITLDTWVSVDIPLTAFNPVDLADVIQFKVDGNGTIWWDNWYFHSDVQAEMPPMGVATTVTGAEACSDDDWTYYEDAANPGDLIFAIDWDPLGTGNNAAAQTGASVTINVDAGVTNVSNGTETTLTMGRYWNVTPGAALVDPVNVKFYYDAGEKAAIEGFINNAGSSEGFAWFKTTGVAFDPSIHVQADVILGDPVELTNVNTTNEMDNGFLYAQFDGITSFSGGTGAGGVGPDSSPLPVELTTFSTTVIDNRQVRLDWATATETNNSHFVVEHSANGRDFVTFDIVEGAGTTAEAQSYDALHESPSAGINYYRLKQVDDNGAYDYSKIITASLEGKSIGFVLSPNPTIGTFSINFQEAIDGGSIQLFDLNGKVVMQRNLATGDIQRNLDVSHLSKGIYLVQIESNGSIEQQKLIIQ